jgi:hypothetical protein
MSYETKVSGGHMAEWAHPNDVKKAIDEAKSQKERAKKLASELRGKRDRATSSEERQKLEKLGRQAVSVSARLGSAIETFENKVVTVAEMKALRRLAKEQKAAIDRLKKGKL